MLNTTDTGAFANVDYRIIILFLPLEFAKLAFQKTNDDKILESALEFCKKNNGNSSGLHDHETNDGVTIKRNVVLLTEDRGLAVKAIADKVNKIEYEYDYDESISKLDLNSLITTF